MNAIIIKVIFYAHTAVVDAGRGCAGGGKGAVTEVTYTRMQEDA
jgi:hypothetical protein